ncbi:MAG: ferritin-like domain-containing protein [Gemmatimonadota bacterium]
MSERPRLTIPDAGMLGTARTRRDVLKMMAMGGALVMLPSAIACSDDDDNGGLTGPGPNTGNAVTIDFAKPGDVGVLQFAYALEQLEADFYTQVVNNFSGSTAFSAAEQAILTDIKYHEVLHRELFKAALGATNGFTLTPTYGNLDFKNRTAVLNAARDFEDLGVAAYNGAGQYLTVGANLTLAGKIVSVEARHAAVIRDLINPKSADFAPNAFDDVKRPATVRTAAQGFVVDKLTFANPPATFANAPGTNNTTG